MPTIKHAKGTVTVTETTDGKRHVSVKTKDPNLFVSSPSCETTYPLPLIEAILGAKDISYVCDEILRDEDPYYIEHHLVTTLFSFVKMSEFNGKRMLDFGCGSGASTMIFARHLPETSIVGIELEETNLKIARLRAAHYGHDKIQLLQSPSGDKLPDGIGTFDMIFMPAVYEHLLPAERDRLSGQLWSLLRPGGILFIDETPHRWFPVETHTTGLPFINYLPNGLARWFAANFSNRNMQNDSWETMLRKGIRGSTITEILGHIKNAGGKPELLDPLPSAPQNFTDIWFEGYARNASGRSGQVKRLMRSGLKAFNALTGSSLVPYISMAVRKRG